MLLLRVELPNVPGSLGRLATRDRRRGRRHRGDRDRREARRRHRRRRRAPRHGRRRDARLRRVGLQRGRRRAGAVDQPLPGRRQPLPRPRGGRVADRRPRDRPRPAGRGAAGGVPLRVGGAARGRRRRVPRSSTPARARRPSIDLEPGAGLDRAGRSATTWSRRPGRPRAGRGHRAPRRAGVPRLRAGPARPPGRRLAARRSRAPP